MKGRCAVLEAMEYDPDRRAELIRRTIYERIGEKRPVSSPDHIVGAYFVASRTLDVTAVGESIAYFMTSAVHDPPAGTLLAGCTGQVLGADPFDSTERVGLVWVGFPVKMMQYPDGKVYSTDILHLMAGEGALGLYDHRDAQLAHLEIPERVLAAFPGPAYGAGGIQAIARPAAGIPMFGTILKPCSGITPQEVGVLVSEVAGNPLFGFLKEDENFVPGVPFAPVADRARQAVAAIEAQRGKRAGRNILYAPHITAPPELLMCNLEAALEAGVNAVMFSEQFVGGTTRMVREKTAHMPNPPAIYAHNSGISTKTRSVWREVLDFLARLDGADFRQTGVLTIAAPFLRPYGLERQKCEEALTRPAGHIKPVMVARAGGLDQGNIILNLRDAQERGYGDGVLYLAGSAIGAITDDSGRPSAELGSAAMLEAVEAFSTGAVTGNDPERHLEELYSYARSRGRTALRRALEQRYPRLLEEEPR